MSSFAEGQVHQLVDKLEAEGFSAADLTKLGQFPNLVGIKAAVNGQAKIVPVAEDASRVITINPTTIVVLPGPPKLPFEGARVESHIEGGPVILEKRADGQVYLNGRKIVLYLSKRQKGGKAITGYELREELTGKLVPNANVLDALFENPHLIPEDWKKNEQVNTQFIYFWGTIYRGAGGHLCVRCLYFDGGAWSRSSYWLENDWYGHYPAASLASI